MTIKNIIFDLGGVVINIDYNRTLSAFKSLGAFNIQENYTQSKQDFLFDNYETGKISSEEFRYQLNSKLNLEISDSDFDNAWNKMLLDLPIERLIFIKNLRENYRVFLFSNTNEIHLKEVFNICKKQNGFDSFDGIFEKEYYSHKIGFKKPDSDSFKKILIENSLLAEETLFIDDSIQHVLGARDAKIHAVHLSNGNTIFDTMSFIQNIEETESAKYHEESSIMKI